MFIGYTVISSKGKGKLGVGVVLLIVAFGVYCLDVYFDSLTADYLRFGRIVSMKEYPLSQDVHLLFRVLIGGISTVGESLAVAIILGMPLLKKVISDALPKQTIYNKPRTYKPFTPSNVSPERKFRQEVIDRLPKG